MTTKTKIISGSIALLAAFLLGFVPQYLDKSRVGRELAASGERVTSLEGSLRVAELRELCGMMQLEALQQNYGLAREHSTQYFEKLRLIAEGAPDPSAQPLKPLLDRQNSITALLSQPDPASAAEIRTLCRQTYEVTKR